MRFLFFLSCGFFVSNYSSVLCLISQVFAAMVMKEGK